MSYAARDRYAVGSLGDPVLVGGALVYGYDPAGGGPQAYPPGFDRPGFYRGAPYDRSGENMYGGGWRQKRHRRRQRRASAEPDAEESTEGAAGERSRRAAGSVRGRGNSSGTGRGGRRGSSSGRGSRRLGWMQDDDLESRLIDGSGQAPGHRPVVVSWAACAWGFGAVDNAQHPLRVRPAAATLSPLSTGKCSTAPGWRLSYI